MKRRAALIAGAIVVVVLATAMAFGSWFAGEERRVVGRAAMQAELTELAGAQSRYFSRFGTFASDLEQLDTVGIDLRSVDLVGIIIEHADSSSWQARATNSLDPGSCTIDGRAPSGPSESAPGDGTATPQCR